MIAVRVIHSYTTTFPTSKKIEMGMADPSGHSKHSAILGFLGSHFSYLSRNQESKQCLDIGYKLAFGTFMPKNLFCFLNLRSGRRLILHCKRLFFKLQWLQFTTYKR